MGNPTLRIYDEDTDRLVTASPNIFMVWKGSKPGTPVAGPHELTPAPRTEDDLREAYRDWIEAGEPN